MTALAAERIGSRENWGLIDFTLTSGTKAWKNGMAGLDVTTGKVKPMVAGSTLLFIGKFNRTVDAAAAEKIVSVRLHDEIAAEYWENLTAGDAVAATDVGKICYVADDQSVTITPLARQVAGVVLKVSTEGVLVMALPWGFALPCHLPALNALGAFAAGDLAITSAMLVHEAVYDLPATAANSTISLPTAVGNEGKRVHFVADGTKNGHTLTLRDVATAITAAATASKRLMFTAVARDGKWYATLAIAP
jgi:hypothetical protein